MTTTLAILSFCAVIAGWVWRYFGTYLGSHLGGAAVGCGRQAVADQFVRFLASPQTMLWQLLVLGLAIAVFVAGVRNGIERVARIVMPLVRPP
ncbi:DUF3623 family protein [Hydrogenophaga sp. 2FB]|uniref:DUF3623 family protein n=1 Tax=Hydrogenophaga sp. 2FB TaxID=2502187 RepID=UPI001485977D|nr:DUF3623 family protein [Hydrogenophaga sp. 2FB]